MKILHVLDHSIPLHSGYTFRSRAIIREQHKRGWQTCHVTSEKQGQTSSSQECVDGLLFYRTEPRSNVLSKLPALNQWEVVRGLSRRLEEVVRLEEPDLIHAHSPVLTGAAAASIGKKSNIPVVYEVRAFWEDAAVDHGVNKEGDLRYRLTRHLESRVFSKVSAITCICEGLKKDIVARGVPENKVTIIPNAVDIDQFDLIDQKDQLLFDKLGLKDRFTIGFIGSFYAYEGLDLLLNAVAHMIQAGASMNCLLVGGGPQEENLKRQASDLGISDYVCFTGRVPHAEVSGFYSLIDLLAYPRISRRITELVTPLKPLEAMAQGRIFVASDVGGHRELIDHGRTGLLFEKNDTGSLVRIITSFRDGAWNRADLIRNGRDFVLKERQTGPTVFRAISPFTTSCWDSLN